MPRIRSIKPEFFLDFELSKLKPEVRLFFIGLWCQADRSGRLKDEPEKLKVQILPWSKISAKECLDSLVPRWVNRYSVDGNGYLTVKNWKHQKPHHTEALSTIPPPENGNITVKQPLSNRELTSRKGEGKGEGKGECSKLFEQFWELYPKKKARLNAIKAWSKLNPGEELFKQIMAAVGRAAASSDWQKNGGQFIPLPATYINGRRWEDEIIEQKEEVPEWEQRLELQKKTT